MFKLKNSGNRLNITKSLPAPTGGLDYVNPLFSMPETSATMLDNFMATPSGLVTRPGSVNHISGFSQPVRSLHTYASPAGTESLWAACDNGLFDATSSGSVGGVVIALTNGNCISVQIGTGAGNYLFMVNGTDTCKRYDGTTWTSIPAFGTSSNLYNYVALYRQRLFFVKKNSLEIEYLAPNSIAGTATNYPLGGTFSQGGQIVAIIPWTIDSGTGPEDNLVILTDQGQAAVFNGNDPEIWVLRGVYNTGRPLGNRPMTPYGGDVLILTENGVFTLSSLVQSTSIDRVQPITQKIRSYFTEAAKLYGPYYGWQIIVDPLSPYVLVNIPQVFSTAQAVMQSESGSWSTWSGLNTRALGRMGRFIYYAYTDPSVANRIRRIDPALANDAGTAIVGTFSQAYSRWGQPSNKLSTSVKAYFMATQGFSYSMGMAYDFTTPPETTSLSASVASAGVMDTIDEWQTCPDQYSMWKGLRLTVTTSLAPVTYAGADILFTRGGHF